MASRTSPTVLDIGMIETTVIEPLTSDSVLSVVVSAVIYVQQRFYPNGDHIIDASDSFFLAGATVTFGGTATTNAAS